MTWELKRFSTQQLLEELVRRQNVRTHAKPEAWCHDCRHYETWADKPRRGECPDDFNPCTKGHAMLFVVPEEIDDDFGYYRNVCADREARP